MNAEAGRVIDHARSGRTDGTADPAARCRRDRTTVMTVARNRSSVRSPGISRDCAVATANARSRPKTASAEPACSIIRLQRESPNRAGWEKIRDGVTA
jgi:hypothetical protein